MVKRIDHIQRRKAKKVLADIVEKHIHDAFEESARATAAVGSPRSILDFRRWFVAAIDERIEEMR